MPTGRAEAELRERGSRFLARAAPARSAERARRLREEARDEHHDATHHVLAWRGLSPDDALQDDDGEPSGTGGRPCLGALEAAGLRRAAVVVVRWFGGTELGTGGLGRAYGEAARRALAEVPAHRAVRGRRVRVVHAYGDSGAVEAAVERSGAARRDGTWGAEVTRELAVPEERVEALRRTLLEVTGGRAEVEVDEAPVLVPLRG